jgi:hypothetical protein
MSDPKPQNGPASRPGRERSGLRRAVLLLALVSLTLRLPVVLAAETVPSPQREGPELFGTDTPLGRVEYHTGRGLRLGKTGLTIGGFATASLEWLEGGEGEGGIEGVNFLLSFDPVPFVHVFSELEIEQIAELKTGFEGIRSDPGVTAERLYVDLGASDLANLRFGKFQTPIGRWNLTLAEPLTWTTSDPLIVEDVFDELSTGAMLWGSAFPRGGALSYALYGTFLDPIAPDRDAPPAERSAGVHLEWASLGGWTVGASYFASEQPGGEWNHLGGVDGLWRPHERVELTAEAIFGEGSREDGGQWGLYAQAVVETFPTLYAVGRYERFDPPGPGRAVDLFDLGVAWVPVPYIRVKVDYRFADHFDDLSEPGLRSSFSVLF